MKKKSPEKTRKRTSVEALRKEKATTVRVYQEFFRKIQGDHSSYEKIAESLGTDTETLDLLRKDPKYNSLLDKIQTLTTDGLAALMRASGTETRKSANLRRLREKFIIFSAKMEDTLEEWYTTHRYLSKAVNGEIDRLKLRNTLLKKVEVDSADKLNTETIGMHKDIVKLIKKTYEFKQAGKKIKTASLDEIIRFAKDGAVFAPLDKKIGNIVKAENKRQELLSYLENDYAENEARKINRGSNKLEEIKAAMKNSSIYKEFIKKLRSADTDKMLAIEKNKAELERVYKKIAVIGYQYSNEIRINEALTPYLKEKPKGFARAKYFLMLKKSPFYKKALVDANSENFSIQKNFNPARYFNYKSEAGAESKNTLYNYAIIVKESLSKNPDVGTAASTDESE